MDKSTLKGGKPVWERPFPSNALGAALIGKEELDELSDVVAEKSPFRHYGLGEPKKVAQFEEQVRNYIGCRYALAVSSGSAALYSAVAALGLGPGDEVILGAFTWYSDYCALVNLGVLPVFAEIGEDLNIDPADFEKKITSRTKAVIVVHYQGGAAQMNEIKRIAEAREILIIEDCAQSMGGMYEGKRLGSFGDVSILSFQAHKTITCGEGGMLLTDNEEYFARAARYHDLGLMRSYFSDQLNDKALADEKESFSGMQFRMSELQGAFMLAQFRKLDIILDKCRRYHKMVRDYFRENGHFRIRYNEGDSGITVSLLFNAEDEAENFSRHLSAEGVRVGPASACTVIPGKYPIKSRKLAHDALPPFGKGFLGEDTKYSPEICCPKTEGILSRYISVSIGPQFTDEDIKDLIIAIEKVDQILYR